MTDWTGLNIAMYIYEIDYITHQLDQEAWRELLITLKDAQEKDIIVTPEKKKTLTEHQYVLQETWLAPYKREGTEGRYILLPIVDKDNPIYFMEGDIYCINPYSENKALAIDVLCRSLKPEHYIDSINSMIYNNKEWYTEYDTCDIEAVIANKIIFDESSFEKYTYAINHARPSCNILGESYAFDTFNRISIGYAQYKKIYFLHIYYGKVT